MALKLKFCELSLGKSWLQVKEDYPVISDTALMILLPFSTKCLCELWLLILAYEFPVLNETGTDITLKQQYWSWFFLFINLLKPNGYIYTTYQYSVLRPQSVFVSLILFSQ
jgi:hypothetical protein